jgi:hypothetical protein
MRSIVSGCPAGRDWNLRETFFLGPGACPKALETGPCDGSRVDGTCEFGHAPCFFHRVLALANWQNKLERLEGDGDA